MKIKTIKGKQRKKRLSGVMRGACLYINDETEFKVFMQTNNLTQAAAIRKIVSDYFTIQRLQKHGFDQTNQAVKVAQSEVVQPLSKTIDKLENSLAEIRAELNGVNQILTKNYQQHEAFRSNLYDYLKTKLATISDEMKEQRKITLLTALNVITVRGLFYVYLIGLKFGSVQIRQLSETEVESVVTSSVVEVYGKAKTELRDLTDNPDKSLENYTEGKTFEVEAVEFMRGFMQNIRNSIVK